MPELHVLEEIQGLRHRDVAVRLEQHHGNRLSGKHVTDHELGQHVESELSVGDALYHADGHQENNRNQHGDDHCPPGQVGIPDEDRNERQGEQDDEKSIVPPVRGVGILPHHLQMNVGVLVPGHLAALPDFGAVKDGCMHDDGGEGTERDTVCEREEGAQEQRRVLLVCVNIECLLGGQNLRHIVCGTGIVESVRLWTVRQARVNSCAVGALTLAIGKY